MSNPTWGVVMTVREPAQLVIANVHYHLGQGASEVHVFLDDPSDPVGGHLQGVDGCSVYRCNDDHWTIVNKGRRPEHQARRQALNANHVYQKGALDWLVHLDADEFLYQKRPLVEELIYAPRTPGYLAFPVRERAYFGSAQENLFDGPFRVPFKGRNAMLVPLFGELGPFLTLGVAGHAAGKSCVPMGFDLRMGAHGPRTKKGKKMAPLHSTSTVLLHFDGLTPLHWILKMLRYAVGNPQRLVGPHRIAQLTFIEEACSGLGEIREFHDMLKSVDDEQNRRLLALGLLEALPFDVGDAARVAVNSAGLSFSADVFDKELRLRNADLLDGLHA
ncbi:MAG: glycosyltransferase family 2 protein [Paracoccaceae bacterium]|nr:glycosyltransferase family 2 protein [Paracoccaceae bacterium]MDG1737089.1 glycosyltransferase family 2 protein [Paracoccaceae bacterium]MDG2258443.1 glycosyltransferase family 2 protein [Paracoccaceae bacterium]